MNYRLIRRDRATEMEDGSRDGSVEKMDAENKLWKRDGRSGRNSPERENATVRTKYGIPRWYPWLPSRTVTSTPMRFRIGCADPERVDVLQQLPGLKRIRTEKNTFLCA